MTLAWRHLPNLITGLRLLMVLPLSWLLWVQDYALALTLFFIAGLSDALDGFLAKSFGWTSRLGGLLDPIADKALLVSCYALLTWHGLLPWWLFAVVLGRDLIILGGALAYQVVVAELETAPSVVSKLNTLAQILLVLGVLVDAGWQPLPGLWMQSLIYSVLATGLISGADYVWTWGWRAWNNKRGSGRFP